MPEPQAEFHYVGFGRRVLATLVDACCVLPFSVALFTPLRIFCMNQRTALPSAAWYLLMGGVNIFLVSRFGGTPGKLLLGFRIVDRWGRRLTRVAAALRLAPLMVSCLLTLVADQLIFMALPARLHVRTLKEFSLAYSVHRSPVTQLLYFLWFSLALVDVLLILRGRQEQTGHDRLAGSFVVRRDSLVPPAGSPADLS